MGTNSRFGIWIIATGVIIALLFYGRDILSPFALAVFLFLTMEGFSQVIDRSSNFIGPRFSRAIAIATVLFGFGLFIVMMATGIAQFSSQSAQYELRINALIADAYALVGVPNAPTLSGLLIGETGQKLAGSVASSIGNLSENLILILIYIAFLFLAQAAWPKKLDAIFPEGGRRQVVRDVGDASRRGIESYLWTQTVISAIITLLTYITLQALGVKNALFLAGLIFILNYIPTIGSIVAALVPPLFALVQPEATWPAYMPDNTYINAALVFAGVSFWQFAIGNFIQPRMMGDSLNLSALVVLLALAIWGALWGIPGMFLSAPLTVIMMILFSKSSDTYWLAVLLSANGSPGPDPRVPLQPVSTEKTDNMNLT